MAAAAFSLLGVVLLLLAAEVVDLRRQRRTVGIRVHVNGTRGKSTVTRLIAAGLRADGRRIVAKITGVIPTVILPDGTSEVLHRRGGPRVQEQIRLLRRASRLKADALVAECMSVTPEYQQVERRVFQPDVYVLTNIRADHFEVMGADEDAQAVSLCSAIPRGGIVVTAERTRLEYIRSETVARGGRLVAIDAADGDPAAVNTALAVRVCELLGCDPESAAAGIAEELQTCQREEYLFSSPAGIVRFVDAFAVNDVPSAAALLAGVRRNHPNVPIHMLLNTRADRPLRTREFARWLGTERNIGGILLAGTHAPAARRLLTRHGFDAARISLLTSQPGAAITNFVKETIRGDAVIIGIMNIGGDGFAVLEALRKEADHDH